MKVLLIVFLLLSIVFFVLDRLITGLIQWDYERNNPSYIEYEGEESAKVYVYERQGRHCKYCEYKFIKDEEKWHYQDSIGKPGKAVLAGVMMPLIIFAIEHYGVRVLIARSILMKDLRAGGKYSETEGKLK